MSKIPVSRTIALLAAISFVLAAPVGTSESADTAGCVNVLYMQYGDGVHIVAGVLRDVTVRVSSGAPLDGFTVGFVIYPQLCKVAASAVGDISSTASSASSPFVPDAPTPPATPEFPTLP